MIDRLKNFYSKNAFWCNFSLIIFIFLYFYGRLYFASILDGTLTGEERSCSIRDAAYFLNRYQFHQYSTNMGAHFLYAVSSFLFPFEPIFYGRLAKILMMSTAPALVFTYLNRVFKVSAEMSFLFALIYGFLPGVYSFSFIATEYGLTTVFGVLGLIVLSSNIKYAELISGFLFGFACIVYAPAFTFLTVFILYLFLLSKSSWPMRLSSIAVMVLTMFSPKIWWLNSRVVLFTGGGRLVLDQWYYRLTRLWEELFINPKSYYYFSEQQALSSYILAFLFLMSFIFCLKYFKKYWQILLILFGTIFIHSIAGGPPGFRRIVPLAFALVCMSAVFIDSFKFKKLLSLFLVLHLSYQVFQMTRYESLLKVGSLQGRAWNPPREYQGISLESILEEEYQNLDRLLTTKHYEGYFKNELISLVYLKSLRSGDKEKTLKMKSYLLENVQSENR